MNASIGVIKTSFCWNPSERSASNGGLANGKPQVVGEDETEGERNADAGQGFQNAAAQFLEVFEKRHAQHAVLVASAVVAPGRRSRRIRGAAAVAGFHSGRRGLRFPLAAERGRPRPSKPVPGRTNPDSSRRSRPPVYMRCPDSRRFPALAVRAYRPATASSIG